MNRRMAICGDAVEAAASPSARIAPQECELPRQIARRAGSSLQIPGQGQNGMPRTRDYEQQES